MIRPFIPEDINALLYLIEQNIPSFFAEEEREDFFQYLQKEAEEYFVADCQGKLLASGGINYFPEDHIARISWDIVHPDFQGKGLGSALVNHRLQTIRNHSQIHKVVVRTSQLAYSFYEKQGFQLKKKEPDYWGKGYDLYYMEMDIQRS